MSRTTGPKKVLVTRPENEAAALASILTGKGFVPLVAPLLDIEPRPGLTVATHGAQALLVTSANAILALAALGPIPRGVPLVAVGKASAAAARAAGFTTVIEADGDVHALSEKVKAIFDPGKGRLIHLSGAQIARDLADLLGPDGFSVERIILYDADAAEILPAEARAALLARQIAAILFFSPRTAEIFTDLVAADPDHAQLTAALAEIHAICLSPAIAAAAKLHEGGWKSVEVATQPTQEALIERLTASLPPEPAPTPDTKPPVAPLPPVPASAPAKSRSVVPAALLSALVVVGASFGGLYVTRDQWLPALGVVQGTGSEQERLNAYVARLESRLAEQDQARQGLRLRAEEFDKAQAALAQRVAKLESALSALPNTAAGNVAAPTGVAPPPPPAPLPAPVVHVPPELIAQIGEVAAATLALQTRVKNVEEQTAIRHDADLKRAGLALAVVQLTEAARRGEGFAKPLSIVAAMGLDDPGIRPLVDKLTPQAEAGLPTLDSLRASYPAAARAARTAARQEAHPGWRGRIEAFASELVHIRSSETPPGDLSTTAKLARAEDHLARGAVIEALGELESLSGAAGTALAPWLSRAKLRRDGEILLNELHVRAVARLADLPRTGG